MIDPASTPGRARALLLGCPWGTLYGVHNSLAVLRASLIRRGFTIADERCGPEVGRTAVLTALGSFIENTQPGDAAAIVYVGHGGRLDHEAADAPDATADGRSMPVEFHALLPTDARRSTAEDCRAVTSYELLAALRALVARTANVTIILDCCHAAGLVLDPEVTSELFGRTWEPVARAQVGRTLANHRGPVRSRNAETHPELGTVVRIVASSALERAYEEPYGDGEHIGSFSRALAEVLDATAGSDHSWVDVADAVHARVHAVKPAQWTGLEGPRDRVPFTLQQRPRARDCHSVHQGPPDDHGRPGALFMAAGWLHGVARGDRFAVQTLGVDGWPGELVAHAVAVEVEAQQTRLHLELNGRVALPGPARAVRVAAAQPLTVTCTLTHDDRSLALNAAAAAAGLTLRRVDAAPQGPSPGMTPGDARGALRGPTDRVVAHVDLGDHHLRVCDPDGTPRGVFALADPLAALTGLTRLLARMAAWHSLYGALLERPWSPRPDELTLRGFRDGTSDEVDLATARAGDAWVLQIQHAGELAPRLHCAVFRVTEDRELVHLTAEHAHGLPVTRGPAVAIGQPLAGDRRGVRFDGAPNGPGDEWLLVIVDRDPLQLHGMATPQLVRRGPVIRGEPRDARDPWCWLIACRVAADAAT